MPTVSANQITIGYDQQGTGEPLILIPYLAADHACYAFQVAAYAAEFTCISIDLRGTGESNGGGDAYSTEVLADDVAAFMQAAGIPRAHVAGLSLGAAVGAWLAAKYPDRVQSLSLHGCWTRTDPFIRTVVEGWQLLARQLGNVAEMVVRGIFPWCFTPELYASRPEYIQSLADFVRSRPAQPLEAFLRQSNAVLGHDLGSALERIAAPTLITFGQHDLLTSRRFADPMRATIRNSEMLAFEGCAHAGMYEHVDEFNAKTLAFMRRHAGASVV